MASAAAIAAIAEQRRQSRQRCALVVPGFKAMSPADEFRRMADWCEQHEVAHDSYGAGEVVEAFERKIATLLDKPAAVFLPSGVMAQLTALRIWTEAARLPRVGLHPTSHLLLHEQQSYQALMQWHGVPVGDRSRPLTASDLEAVKEPLACVIAELPIREAGGQLPSWTELEALKSMAQARNVRLHMDGARLWESAAYYGKSYAQIAAGFDSVYVSVYKGIGALSGALLAGDADFIAQARLWRSRLGGTLYHLSPMVVSAAMRFDDRIALMPALHRCTLQLAIALAGRPGLRLNPATPHTNMLHLHFDAPAEAVLAARDAIAAEHACWLVDGVRPVDVPGWSVSELSIGDRLLNADLEHVVAMFDRLCIRMMEMSP